MLVCPPKASAADVTNRIAIANLSRFTKKFSRTRYAKSTRQEACRHAVLRKRPRQG